MPIKNDQSNGTRSITEYGKRLMPFPLNIKAEANKNMVTLSWDEVKDATGYKVYRDDELIQSAPENSYADYKLKFETCMRSLRSMRRQLVFLEEVIMY